MDAALTGQLGHVVERVDQARMCAAQQHYGSGARVEEHRLVVRERIGHGERRVQEEGPAGVFELRAAGDLPRDPYAGPDLGGCGRQRHAANGWAQVLNTGEATAQPAARGGEGPARRVGLSARSRNQARVTVLARGQFGRAASAARSVQGIAGQGKRNPSC